MTQTCTRCSRANPPDAIYCYFDGMALPGHHANGGPATAGAQPFVVPFVFPSGRTCRSHDELALACQEHWSEARDVLQQGFFDTFFSSIGRSDLALAAREANRYPDRDRGLDQLLAKLPTHSLWPPKLQVETRDINLGVMPSGTDRSFQIHLENQGMRLLYGSVSCGDCLWLALGDAPGAPEKLFQFGGHQAITVHIRGKHLRAGPQPLEGQLIVESNGGTSVITVRVEVPVKPFPEGCVFSGARSPRQVAEKAKLNPKDAAPLFEKGLVAEWYESNGWVYPVQGPSASGLGAVQQFFEALGLTPPPKVKISEKSVQMQGNVGDNLRHVLEVQAQEKRPVYAHGTSDQPWLEIGRARLNGRTATIPIVVPSVPDREGETLNARVTVTANGNQRFVVPVTLVVGGSFHFGTPAPTLPAPVEVMTSPVPVAPLAPAAPPPRPAATGGPGIHLLPALALLVAVMGIVGWDAWMGPGQESGGRSIGKEGSAAGYVDLSDTEPYLMLQFNERQRFGILMAKARDPENPDKMKRLTYEENGGTNNTCVRIDGYENLFGQRPGKWISREGKLLGGRIGRRSVMEWPTEQVEVSQLVEVMPGDQTRVLDTLRVTYEVHNKSTATHKVGLRVLLDTYIGANDGVPFVVPGQPGLLDTMRVFPFKDIPDYIQALEKPDLANPGTIAHLGLKFSDEFEPIEKMIVCRWPGNPDVRWSWSPEPMNVPRNNKDSCVVLYWAERPMAPGEKRVMRYSYGLNKISSVDSQNASLSLTVGGSFRPGGEFTVTAYVKDAQRGQKATLRLPPGLTLLPGQEAEQTIDRGGELSQVSWRVRGGDPKEYVLEVTSGIETERYAIRIRDRGIFD